MLKLNKINIGWLKKVIKKEMDILYFCFCFLAIANRYQNKRRRYFWDYISSSNKHELKSSKNYNWIFKNHIFLLKPQLNKTSKHVLKTKPKWNSILLSYCSFLYVILAVEIVIIQLLFMFIYLELNMLDLAGFRTTNKHYVTPPPQPRGDPNVWHSFFTS